MGRLIRAELAKLQQLCILGLIFFITVIASYWISGILYENSTMQSSESFGEMVFVRSMSQASYTAWIAVIFSCLLIGVDFSDRTVFRSVFAGISRIKYFLFKAAEYYLITLILASLFPLAACLRYSRGWFSTLDSSGWLYVLRCLGMKLIIDTALISISFLLVFLFRDLVRSLVASIVVTAIFIVQLNELRLTWPADSILKKLVDFYPAFQLPIVVQPEITLKQLELAIGTSLIIILLLNITAYLCFRHSELK